MTNVLKVFMNGVEYRVYDHLYLVAADGSMLRRNGLGWVPVKMIARPDGYIAVGRQRLAHRMVAICWIDNLENRKHVHHKDGNKAHNHVDNLEWVTPKEHVGEKHIETAGRHVCPDSAKEKLRQHRLGQKHSEETKRKITEGLNRVDWASKNLKGRPGRAKTPEEIVKIVAGKVQPLMIDGVRFESMVQAEQWLGIKKGTIRRRCLSKNFPNYYWLPREYVKPPRRW